MQQSIDIVIPSFRLNEKVLIEIFSLRKPEGYEINYFLVADNPSIAISQSFSEHLEKIKVHLIINGVNLGFSKTRNKGIDAGIAEWVLLLDDDIIAERDLLIFYADAIQEHPDSLGFAGSTQFPKPFNTVTQALYLNGSVGHFSPKEKGKEIAWTPTANVLLNRKKLSNRRFKPELVNGGEDIELLFKNCVENSQKYITIPDAMVTHPWWDNGKSQLKRMFRYGQGIGDIINLPYQKKYSYIDFTTTTESIFFFLLASALLWTVRINATPLLVLTVTILIAELITNSLRSISLSGKVSISLAFQMFLHKNAFEGGVLFQILKKGKLKFLFRRLDVTFRKPNPSPFRLNRWKIIKLWIIVTLSVIYLIV
jgi:glycosyltransferase involved in cell wall biosynthesis